MSALYPNQPLKRRASAQRYADTITDTRQTSDDAAINEDRLYDTRLPTSTRRYKQPQTTQQAVVTQRPREVIRYEGHYYYRKKPTPQPRRATTFSPRFHWLFYVGLAMFMMLLGWWILSSFANWVQATSDDWHYGRPRTYQTDAVVGNDSAMFPSHFIALNIRRHIIVMECPASDCTKAKIYTVVILTQPGDELIPVTITFKDVNHDHKPDMLVVVGTNIYVFINENGIFRPQRTNEQVTL
jgi:hypothetical protein